jgi:pyridoxine/pyridoxamine 5'-phosphate oxidase
LNKEEDEREVKIKGRGNEIRKTKKDEWCAHYNPDSKTGGWPPRDSSDMASRLWYTTPMN